MTRTQQAGVSLVELMVGLVIGLFLSAGIIQVFSANKQTNRFVESSTRQHENIRFAIDVVSEQLRSAGFAGCVSDPGLRVNMLTTSAPILSNVCAGGQCDSADMLDIVTSGGTRPYSYSGSTNRMPTNSVEIGFYRSDPVNCGTTTSTGLTRSSTNIALSTACELGVDPYLMLATCSGLSIIQANADDGTGSVNPLPLETGSSFALLPYDYPEGTDVYRLQGSLFYVDCQSSDDSDCGLYYDDDIDDSDNSPEELVQGVADMRARYGVDTDTPADGSADRFVDDPSTLSIGGVDNPWHRVVSLRIAFLTVSNENNLVDSPVSYTFPPWASSDTTPTDRRIRRVYTTTVALRNRIANLRNNL